MHSILPFLLAMVAAIVLLNILATKLKVAYPIVLVIAGLLISFVPGLPIVRVDPDMIFFIFLPPLLFEACWSASFKEMRKWWRIITSFAFLVVFFTALTVAIVVNHYIPGFTIALGFLLGGIVSPPDAVSTAAITKFVKIPKSFSAILEGESLLNDASSLIIFRFALIAVGTGQFIWQDAATGFLWMVFGGAGIGLVLAFILAKIQKWLPTDAPSDITLTLIHPYLLYWVAEQVHSSGVLAVVCGGLYLSSQRLQILNSASRVRGFSVWESFIFILNGLVFLLIGLELPEIVTGLRSNGISVPTAIGYGVLVTLVLIVARIISSYIAMLATLIFRRSVAPQSTLRGRLVMPLILGWTGMRGVVSLAAALAIPLTLDDGSPFPQRNLILFITFIVILLTLVVQGLTLPYFIKKANIFVGTADEESEEATKLEIKKGLKIHILSFLKSKYANEFKDNKILERLVQQWEERVVGREEEWMNDDIKKVIVDSLNAQREYLNDLNKDPNINEEIIRQQLYQIDLEEERLKII